MSSLIFSENSNQSKDLSRKCKKGLIRRLLHGVYTENLVDSVEDIISKEWMAIVSHAVPNGILSHRTALELRPVLDPIHKTRTVFVTSTYSKKIIRGPIVIKVNKGNTNLHVESIVQKSKRSNEARAILENLSPSRKVNEIKKSVGEQEIEEYLAIILRNKGETYLNRVRDEAKIVAHDLGLHDEYSKLNLIISLLLSTHKGTESLKTDFAISILQNNPFDRIRVSLFQSFALYLTTCTFRERYYHFNTSSWKSLSFFESYFSNYIEGTRFLIDEAEDILFKGVTIHNRHEDSHDVLALYCVTSDFSEISKTPDTFEQFELLLKERHAVLMKERRNKNPGKFKELNNKAGSTIFVNHDEVLGTLQQGFDVYRTLKEGMPKAIFMMFLVTEVHPFDDGNGRLARLMMNSELVASDQIKCIVPTAHRDNYLNGLRRGSRESSFNLLCRSMDLAQAYTNSIDWIDYDLARRKIEEDMADQEPDEGLAQFNRALKKVERSDMPV